MQLHRNRFQQLPWSTESVSLKIPPKSRLQSMEPTHPDRLVENATAPSAGGFPGPDGKADAFSDDLKLDRLGC
jgi:hypothetical protein